ncbi:MULTISPECIES: AfsR/SARP family transcriptional regulator [unclassified Streptomyces]|uniref:AfsR/SARP family transcriptional regulator n=1 Tax=unclassified Streptomyces TaxID=2593676 RepID=UPI0033B2CA80
MQFRVFGTLEIFDEVRQRRIHLNSPKQRLLLGALLARPSSPVPKDELIREVWGERAPDKAANALQAHVSRLRQLLIESEPARANTPRLIARGPGYLLHVRPEELDCVEFRLLAARARKCVVSDPATAVALLQRALMLWRGPAQHGSYYGPLYTEAAARLEEERLRALENLYNASVRIGRYRQVLAPLEELVAAHPDRVGFRSQLVLARHHAQCRAEATTGSVRRAGTALSPGHRPDVRTWPQAGTNRSAAERGGPVGADSTNAQEIDRLRKHVDRLTDEQQALRAALEYLSSRVPPLPPHLAPVPHPETGELSDSSGGLLARVLSTRPGAYFSPSGV